MTFMKNKLIKELFLIVELPSHGNQLLFRYPDEIRIGTQTRSISAIESLIQSNSICKVSQFGLLDDKPIRFMPKKQFLDLMGPNKNYDKLLVQIQKRTYFTCSRSLDSKVLGFSLVAELFDIKEGDNISKALQFMASALSFQNSVRPIFEETLVKLKQSQEEFKKKVSQMCRSRVLPYDNYQQKKILSTVSKEFLNRFWLYERLSKFYTDINLAKPYHFNSVLSFVLARPPPQERAQPYHSLFVFKSTTVRNIGRLMTQRMKRFLELIQIQKSLAEVQNQSCFSIEQIQSMANHLIENYNCLIINPINSLSLFTVNQKVKISKLIKNQQIYSDKQKVSLLKLIQNKFNAHCSPLGDPEIDISTLRLLIGNQIIKEVFHYLIPIFPQTQPTFPLALRIFELLQDTEGIELIELSFRLGQPCERVFNQACSGSNRWWKMTKY